MLQHETILMNDRIFTTADAMLQELAQLSLDVPLILRQARSNLSVIDADRLGRIISVELVGCGDSRQAAFSALALFEASGCQSCKVPYPRDAGSSDNDDSHLTIGISASGNTPAVLSALERSKKNGHQTMIVTANNSCRGLELADHQMVQPLADKADKVPGLRSYQNSLIGLITIALKLGLINGRLSTEYHSVWQECLDNTERAIEATAGSAISQSHAVANLTMDSDIVFLLGDRSNLPTAQFCAAKRMEASGNAALVQDIEEYWHIERFSYTRSVPLVLFRSEHSAQECCKAALTAECLGHPVITIGEKVNHNIATHSDYNLTVEKPMHPLLMPLLDYIPFSAVTAHEAILLDRLPFRADDHEKMARMKKLIAKKLDDTT